VASWAQPGWYSMPSDCMSASFSLHAAFRLSRPRRSVTFSEPVAAQDGSGQRVIAVLTLAFAPVTRAMPGVSLGPAGEGHQTRASDTLPSG
jgi:hypothetical protein